MIIGNYTVVTWNFTKKNIIQSKWIGNTEYGRKNRIITTWNKNVYTYVYMYKGKDSWLSWNQQVEQRETPGHRTSWAIGLVIS